MEVAVGRLSELVEGKPKVVRIDGREIGVIRWRDRIYALRNVCPHHGAPLCRGLVGRGILHEDVALGSLELDERTPAVITCPWHQWEFNLATGRPYGNNRLRVRVYPTVVKGDEVFVVMDNAAAKREALESDQLKGGA